MRLMRVVGGVLTWGIGVAAVAALASVAINSAGQQVVARTVIAGQPDGLTAVTPTTGPTPSGPSPSPSPSASLGPATAATSTTSEHAKDPGSSSATAGPTTSTSRTATKSAEPTRPTPPAPTSAPTVTPMSDVRGTSGGAVWVECTGPLVTDALVQPNDGWSARTGQHGPGDLQAHFVRSSSRIEVTVVCSGGQPYFSVKSGSSHEHEDD